MIDFANSFTLILKNNMTKEEKNKILGSMVGGAVGDALGYAVEFMSYSDIVARYGKKGITRYELDSQGVAEISDDTQMALFVANGLMLGDTYISDKGIGSPHNYDSGALYAWYITQTQKFDTPRKKYYSQFWLMDDPRMFARRAPGVTCMGALSGKLKTNKSKECGGIVRIAPQALYEYRFTGLPREKRWEITKEMIEYTHHHPLGYLPAILLVDVLCSIMRRSSETVVLESTVWESISAMKFLLNNKYGKYIIMLSDKAFDLAKQERPDHESIAELGEGWTAEETLAIALYCATKYHNDFEKAIVASVNHSGGSDSTGAVTGNIIGAILGRDAIPQHYIDNLELVDVIEEMANDIASGAQICFCAPATEAEIRWAKRYVRSIF